MTPTRPMPPDFPKVAHMPYDVLSKHYHCANTVIKRWREECGVRFEPAPLPDDFQRIAPLCTLPELQRHYKRGGTTIRRWAKETGVRYKGMRECYTKHDAAREIALCLSCPYAVCRPSSCRRVGNYK